MPCAGPKSTAQRTLVAEACSKDEPNKIGSTPTAAPKGIEIRNI